MQQLISTHANCLELRQVIKIFAMSKLKVLEQRTANSKNRNHDRKIRSQTKGMYQV